MFLLNIIITSISKGYQTIRNSECKYVSLIVFLKKEFEIEKILVSFIFDVFDSIVFGERLNVLKSGCVMGFELRKGLRLARISKDIFHKFSWNRF